MSKRLLVPEARQALDQYKMEMAEETTGEIPGQIDWGYMSSYHTGQITRKLVEQAEKQLVEENKLIKS